MDAKSLVLLILSLSRIASAQVSSDDGGHAWDTSAQPSYSLECNSVNNGGRPVLNFVDAFWGALDYVHTVAHLCKQHVKTWRQHGADVLLGIASQYLSRTPASSHCTHQLEPPPPHRDASHGDIKGDWHEEDEIVAAPADDQSASPSLEAFNSHSTPSRHASSAAPAHHHTTASAAAAPPAPAPPPPPPAPSETTRPAAAAPVSAAADELPTSALDKLPTSSEPVPPAPSHTQPDPAGTVQSVGRRANGGDPPQTGTKDPTHTDISDPTHTDDTHGVDGGAPAHDDPDSAVGVRTVWPSIASASVASTDMHSGAASNDAHSSHSRDAAAVPAYDLPARGIPATSAADHHSGEPHSTDAAAVPTTDLPASGIPAASAAAHQDDADMATEMKPDAEHEQDHDGNGPDVATPVPDGADAVGGVAARWLPEPVRQRLLPPVVRMYRRTAALYNRTAARREPYHDSVRQAAARLGDLHRRLWRSSSVLPAATAAVHRLAVHHLHVSALLPFIVSAAVLCTALSLQYRVYCRQLRTVRRDAAAAEVALQRQVQCGRDKVNVFAERIVELEGLLVQREEQVRTQLAHQLTTVQGALAYRSACTGLTCSERTVAERAAAAGTKSEAMLQAALRKLAGHSAELVEMRDKYRTVLQRAEVQRGVLAEQVAAGQQYHAQEKALLEQNKALSLEAVQSKVSELQAELATAGARYQAALAVVRQRSERDKQQYTVRHQRHWLALRGDMQARLGLLMQTARDQALGHSAQVAALHVRLQEADRRIEDLTAHCEGLQALADQRQDELEDLGSQVVCLEKQRDELERGLAQRKATLDVLQRQLQDYEDEAADLAGQVKDQTARADAAEVRCTELEGNVSSLRDGTRRLKAEVHQLHQAIAALDDMRAFVEEAEACQQAAAVRLQEVQAALALKTAEHTEALANHAAELAKAKSELELEVRQHAATTKTACDAQAALDKANVEMKKLEADVKAAAIQSQRVLSLPTSFSAAKGASVRGTPQSVLRAH